MVTQVKHGLFTDIRISIVLVVNMVCLRYCMNVSNRSTLRMNMTFRWMGWGDIYCTWNFQYIFGVVLGYENS